MIKKDIRSEMRLKEQAFLGVPGAAERASSAVVAVVEGKADFLVSKTVLCYMDIPGEVMMRDAIARWLAMGKCIALPLVSGNMLVLKKYDPALLREGYRGIVEPAEDAEDIAPDAVDLALVPGVAFTADGARLGRGKGFYDRLLPLLTCPKFGVCYPFRMVPELPADPWDAPLDAVITAPGPVAVTSFNEIPDTNE